jgi:hypothetical protein
MYMSFESDSWCYGVFCLYMVNGMITVVLISLLCIFFHTMLNV